MTRRLEDILAECLEAVSSGQRTIEECLTLYPQWSDRLEPLLRLGSRLDEASLPEPDRAFQEAARERFLTAARTRVGVSRPPRKLFPSLGALSQWFWHSASVPSRRRLAGAMTAALLIGFLSFSSFVVASAGSTLPGDWRYPVKRFNERARLTFTFGEDARRDYRISLAEERLHEVQELASREQRIGESLLRDLVETTEPLVRTLEPGSVPTDQIERVTDLTARQQDVLGDVAPLVDDEAADELEEAMAVSGEGHEKAVQALALARSEEPPEEILALTTPEAGTPTSEATAEPSTTAEAEPGESPTPEATPTPEQDVAIGASATPAPEATPAPGEPTPVPGEPTSEPASPTAAASAPERQVVSLPEDTTAGIAWSLLTIGDFSLRVPAEAEADWSVSTLTGSGGEKILVGHRWGHRFDAAVVVEVSTGQVSTHVLVDGTVRAVEPGEIRSLVAAPVANVITHVLESVNAGP